MKIDLDQADGLRQLGDPQAGRLEGDPGLVVLLLEPACPDAEFKAAVGEDVDRGGGLGGQGRVAEVVVENERADPHVGDHRRGGQRGNGVEAADEVVQREIAGEPEPFGPAEHRQPVLVRAKRAPLNAESEEPGMGHAGMLRIEGEGLICLATGFPAFVLGQGVLVGRVRTRQGGTALDLLEDEPLQILLLGGGPGDLGREGSGNHDHALLVADDDIAGEDGAPRRRRSAR